MEGNLDSGGISFFFFQTEQNNPRILFSGNYFTMKQRTFNKSKIAFEVCKDVAYLVRPTLNIYICHSIFLK